MLLHFFLTALEMGMRATGVYRYLFPLMGCLVRLSFYGLLRPGEYLRAKVSDFKTFSVGMCNIVGVLAIREPKTRAWLGRSQFSTVRDSASCRWLLYFLWGRGPDESLWPSTAYRFRKLFRDVLETAGLLGTRLTPASGRPGGTTLFFLRGVPVEQIQFMGRWRSTNSLKAYVQEAMAFLVWQNIDESVAAVISARMVACRDILAGPPPVPLNAWLPADAWPIASRRRQPLGLSGLLAIEDGVRFKL